MLPDFYRRVGLPQSATKVEIEVAYEKMRAKYRDPALGDLATKIPSPLDEAFAVLLDDETRSRYDDALRRAKEDLEVTDTSELEPVSLSRNFARINPSLRAVLRHIKDNYRRPQVSGFGRSQNLTMEILLTPDEAARGGVIPVEIPSYRRCGRCGGTGLDGFVSCADCGNEGIVPEYAMLQVEYPKGLADGAVIRRDLRHLGIRNLIVILNVRITKNIPQC